ncbi:MAG: tail-specific protease, partial [Pseudomonadota bacterium]|nr:tail-specific protease [Pseudomonadota bacterium]
MKKNTMSALRSWVIGAVALVTLPVLAEVAEVKPGTPFKPLSPTREEAITTQQVMSNLLRGHYERKRLNNDLSSQVFDTLLDDLDSTRSYFLASDIKAFEPFRYELDEALSRGNMEPAFNVFNRFQQRVSERLSFLLTELGKNAKSYRYDVNESLDLDREDAPWAATTDDLNDLWRKRL